MLRPFVCWLVLLATVLPAWAADEEANGPEKPASPAAQYEAFVKQYQDAQQKFFEQYRKAEDDEARQKLFRELYPKPDKYGAQMLQLATDHPDDPAAVDALVWVVSFDHGPNSDKAMAVLAKDYVEDARLVQVCQRLMYTITPEVQTFLRTAMEKSPHKEVQGWARYSLAKGMIRSQMMRSQREPAKQGDEPSEAEKLFERVAEECTDVDVSRGRTLADMAQSDLFELRHLAIGCVAPIIEGEDIDGVRFTLADYRGKVVVLDFWGHW